MRLIIFLTVFFVSSFLRSSQAEVDPDWPCVQLLIPKISAASIWDGPPLPEGEDEKIQDLARAVIIPVVDDDQPLTELQLADFVTQAGNNQKNKALTFLFYQFLDKVNTKRQEQINTIKRYTRTQQASAAVIEKLLDQIDVLRDNNEQTEQLHELESKLHWQRRMFKQREQTFPFLCDAPQENAQLAGEIARTISAQLD